MGFNKRLFVGGGAGAITPSEHFNPVLYTGNGGSTKEVSVGFTPDLTWVKALVDDSHYWVDSVRGNGAFLFSSSSASNDYNAAHLKLITNGFDAMSNPNVSSRDYISWSWKAGGSASSVSNGTNTSSITQSVNSDAKFSITQFTGNSTNAGTFSHGLGEVPDMIIVKAKTFSDSWFIWHKDLTNTSTNAVRFDSNGEGTNSGFWNNTAPDSTNVSLGAGILVSATYISYAWKSVNGYSKFGTYNGSSSEHTVDFGFAPAFVMIKRIDTTGGWRMFDYKRDSGTGERRVDHSLQAQSTGAQFDSSGTPNGEYLRFTDTGLKFPTHASNQDVNNPSGTYIYMAFARD